jgi:hypothetical protein
VAGEEIGRDVRKVHRQRLLGSDAFCAFCGEPDFVKLMKVKRSRLLERHHVGGQANEPSLTIVLCRNCHAVETTRMLDAAVPLRADGRALPERLGAVLEALAVFFESLACVLREWAGRLLRLVAALDRDAPGWRDLPEATD